MQRPAPPHPDPLPVDEEREKVTRARRIAIGILGGWLASYWLLFSFASGPFHTYYLAALAPPLAALGGIGVAELWRRWREDGPGLLLAVVLFTTAGWQAFIVTAQLQPGVPQWVAGLWIASAATIALGGIILTVSALWARAASQWCAGAVAAICASGALLVMPLVSALSVVIVRPNVAAPAASLAALTGLRIPPPPLGGDATSREKLLAYLRSQRGSERFLVAVPNAIVAAPLIMTTGVPVMAMGGYAGRDPILTPEELSRQVEQGRVRFVMLGGLSFSRVASASQRAISDWVRAHGKPVDAALWSYYAYSRRIRTIVHFPRGGGQWGTMEQPELFDLRR